MISRKSGIRCASIGSKRASCSKSLADDLELPLYRRPEHDIAVEIVKASAGRNRRDDLRGLASVPQQALRVAQQRSREASMLAFK
jgi:hypothetical protein